MKVQLVNPCMNTGYEVNSRNGVMHPLGLLCLATCLKRNISDLEVQILDGSIDSRDAITGRVDADLVGCTTGVLSYEHAIEIAEVAKQRNSVVVFGGPLATELSDQVLHNRPEVDYVIRGDGEIALLDLVKGKNPKDIPNLVWRSKGTVVQNTLYQHDVNKIAAPDRHFLDVHRYFRNYETINVERKFFSPMTFFSGKGCKYASRYGRCSFCARMDCGYRPRNPSLVWDELCVLAEEFGADAFWDVADSAVNDEQWMKVFNAARPSGFTPKLYFYARADAITESMCHLLNSLNCQLVFVGFESGADSILKGVGVGKTVEQSRKAAQLLADHGINIMGSFILGLAGETADTVERTIEFANWLGDLGNLETISASVLMPLPGSKVFNMLRKEYPEKYEAVDFYDLEKARTDWLSSHTKVSLDVLYDKLPSLLSVGKISSSLGRPVKIAGVTREITAAVHSISVQPS